MTPLARLFVGPLLTHMVCATVLWARVAPALTDRLDHVGPVRRSFAALVALLAFVPASVPAALVILAAPYAHGVPRAAWWLRAGAWFVAADTLARAVAAWAQSSPVVLGEIVARVSMSPDALGTWLVGSAPGVVRVMGPLAALGSVQLAAAICAGIAFAEARHGVVSADPLPWPGARGMVAGLAAATVLAVTVRAVSGPATDMWLGILA